MKVGTLSAQLWTFFSKIKGREPVKTPVFKYNGQYVSDPKKKSDLLVNHYQKVSSEEGYDPEFLATRYNLIPELRYNKTP